MHSPKAIEGVLTCARYSFAPNYYKYCGPDANREIASYLQENTADSKLSLLLSQFAVLYPYLKLIASENGLADPFDSKVVEAYWIGNTLLEDVSPRAFAQNLLYGQKLKKRLPAKKLNWIVEKIPKGAKLHHSFHVFNIYLRTGYVNLPHTVDTMDQCRIGWGEILEVKDKVKVKSQRLVSHNKKLVLADWIRELLFPVDSKVKSKIKVGDLVSFHWGFVCDKISQKQAQNLEFYTRHNLKLANETI